MNPVRARNVTAAAVAGVAAMGIAACGGTSTSPPPSTPTPGSVQNVPVPTPLSVQNAVLQVDDFVTGAKKGNTGVPNLTEIKCTPDQAAGLQHQYKSDIVAASGREYGNVLAVFSDAASAHTFTTQFFADAKSCADAASAPAPDSFGTYSFALTVTGSPSSLTVEAVQLDHYVSVIIQYLPQGTQPNQQSLRDLAQTSVNKLDRVGS